MIGIDKRLVGYWLTADKKGRRFSRVSPGGSIHCWLGFMEPSRKFSTLITYRIRLHLLLIITDPSIREFLLFFGKAVGPDGLGVAPINAVQLRDVVLQGNTQAYTHGRAGASGREARGGGVNAQHSTKHSPPSTPHVMPLNPSPAQGKRLKETRNVVLSSA